MNRIKYIIVASLIALGVLLVTTYVISFNTNKSYINIAIASENIKAGKSVSTSNVTWVKMDKSKIDSTQYISEENLSECKGYVLSDDIEKGEVVRKKTLIKNDEYLEKTENLEYIALPIKSATEGVCYKIKKGDKISVYYTAKKKLVDGVLKDKKKIYSVGTSETMVTCLLYENIEIIAMTNNIGQDASGTSVTDVVVKLTQDEALELVNLKEQGTFTLTVK